MRRLKRNQRTFTYCLYTGMTNATDASGKLNGRHTEQYADPVEAKGCIVFKGTSGYKPYGVDDDFKVQIIPDNPIPEINTKTKIIIDGEAYYVTSAPITMNEHRIYAK